MVTPEAVIFDYGGVLRGDGRDIWHDADDAAALPRGALWAAWHDIPEYHRSRQGVIDAATFRAAIIRALTAVAGDGARAETALTTLEARLASLPVIDDDMRALIDRLRAGARVKLGLLSNASRGFSDRLHAMGIAKLFDDVIVSADVGLSKPDPAIFRLTAARLGVAPSACLMIDDQAQHVDGARATGLRAHHYIAGRLDALVAWLESEGVLP